MMKKIGIAVAVVVVAFCAVVAMQPATYKVERSATMAAPADVVFPEIADYTRFNAWSPWAKLDPDMKTEFTGTPMTVGHSSSWKGNDQVGSGKMTITSVTPNVGIEEKLEFIEPFASEARVMLTIKPAGDKSTVTWSMEGNNNFMSKAMGLFMNMDAMIGADFEKGLAALTTITETKQKEIAAAAAAAQAQAEAQAQAAANEVAPSPTTPMPAKK
jgi:hypothetical protein